MLYSFHSIVCIIFFAHHSMDCIFCAICARHIVPFMVIYAKCSLHLSICIFIYVFHSHSVLFISVNADLCLFFLILFYPYCSMHIALGTLFCLSTSMYLVLCIALNASHYLILCNLIFGFIHLILGNLFYSSHYMHVLYVSHRLHLFICIP